MGRFDELMPRLTPLTAHNFVGKGGGLRWIWDSLTPGMILHPVQLRARIAAAGEEFAERAEEYMKQNAPWSDQTGAARDGLTAEAQHGLLKETVILYHTVDYGLWLEVRWSGKYAIIVPTIEALGGEFMGSIGTVRGYVG